MFFAGFFKKLKDNLSKDDIKLVQQVLKDEKLYDGNVDGIMGNGTKNALKKYQKAHKLAADGFLSKELLEFFKKRCKK